MCYKIHNEHEGVGIEGEIAIAAGLLLFGVFSLILARYRIIPDPLPARSGLFAKA